MKKNEIDYCDFLTKQMFFLHLHRDFVLIVISLQDMRGVCATGWQNCVEMEQKLRMLFSEATEGEV